MGEEVIFIIFAVLFGWIPILFIVAWMWDICYSREPKQEDTMRALNWRLRAHPNQLDTRWEETCVLQQQHVITIVDSSTQ